MPPQSEGDVSERLKALKSTFALAESRWQRHWGVRCAPGMASSTIPGCQKSGHGPGFLATSPLCWPGFGPL